MISLSPVDHGRGVVDAYDIRKGPSFPEGRRAVTRPAAYIKDALRLLQLYAGYQVVNGTGALLLELQILLRFPIRHAIIQSV